MLAQTAGHFGDWAAPGEARADREETAWVARARVGDEAAFRWLLGRYRQRTVRLAAHVLRRDSEAEDVAQEAFVRAFRGISGLRGETGFGPWLFQIVVRLCLDRRRLARWGGEARLEDMAERPSPPSDIPDTRLLIEALLDRLSPPLRAALVLREMEGLDYEAVAQVLGVPVGTVRSRLHAARAQFRALWLAAHREDDHA